MRIRVYLCRLILALGLFHFLHHRRLVGSVYFIDILELAGHCRKSI
jgi:hypothetical protein